MQVKCSTNSECNIVRSSTNTAIRWLAGCVHIQQTCTRAMGFSSFLASCGAVNITCRWFFHYLHHHHHHHRQRYMHNNVWKMEQCLSAGTLIGSFTNSLLRMFDRFLPTGMSSHFCACMHGVLFLLLKRARIFFLFLLSTKFCCCWFCCGNELMDASWKTTHLNYKGKMWPHNKIMNYVKQHQHSTQHSTYHAIFM